MEVKLMNYLFRKILGFYRTFIIETRVSDAAIWSTEGNVEVIVLPKSRTVTLEVKLQMTHSSAPLTVPTHTHTA
jgi:hypothetical protein